jgi:glycosyltransferase involved in cell wall biosynthesis
VSVRYAFERKQGRSHALNAGITATDGELVGMVDDEEIDCNWYRTIYSSFLDSGVDFVGGPYLPNWSVDAPTGTRPTISASSDGLMAAIAWSLMERIIQES